MESCGRVKVHNIKARMFKNRKNYDKTERDNFINLLNSIGFCIKWFSMDNIAWTKIYYFGIVVRIRFIHFGSCNVYFKCKQKLNPKEIESGN